MEQSERAFKALTAEHAERATLSAIILKPSVLGWVDLSASHFQLPLHQHVYTAMRGLWEEDKPLDDITILDAIERELPTISLAEVSKLLVHAPTADNIEHWVDILEEHRRKRVLHALTVNASNELLQGDESDAIYDKLIDGLGHIVGDRVVGETMEEIGYQVLDDLERAWSGEIAARLPSGIARLDAEIIGLPIGVPTVIGARPGIGKSFTLWNIANAAVQRGEHVVILTNEDKGKTTYKLGLANASGVERKDLAGEYLSEDQRRRIRDAIASTAESNRRFHIVPVHGKKMVEICRIARAFIRKYKPTIIALDYIQNVPNPEPGMNRNYGIEENLTNFDALVAEEQVVGIIAGQLKRMEPGAIPTMADLKDSGSIEQKAKLMLTLSDRPPQGGSYFPGEPNFRIGVVKNSEGLSDFEVDFRVNKGLGTFS